MNALPLALSLSSSFTEVGAIAGFAALLGIALLSLLAFSQAREIKRLREWAGRAPERASELEQRVSAEAAARIQHAGQPATPAGGRVVPRKTPLVSAPVSTAVNATVAAVVPGASGAPGVPGSPAQGAEPGSKVAPPPAAPQPAASVSAGQAASSQPAASVPIGQTVSSPPAASVPTGQGASQQPSASVSTGQPAKPASGDDAAISEATGDAGQEGAVQPSRPSAAAAPATAAGRAAGEMPRAPLPPSPTAPKPASRPPAIAAQRPPAAAAARRVPSRPVASRPADEPAGTGGPKYFKPERSAARATALIVGGVIVGVLVLVLAVSALKGGGKAKSAATQGSSLEETRPASTRHTSSHATASKPSEIAVVVLNGTSTPGLAHHLASDLQQSGYTRATALAGVPPGTHATTVVEYTHGHRADGQAVAKTLNVTSVQAIEGSTAALAGSATVVVLGGADQAAQLGGGGAQSNGEPAAGATGQAGTGAAGEGTAGSGQ